MTPKDELLKIQRDTEKIKRETKELVEELEQIDNEALIRQANGVVNERFIKAG